MADTPISGFVGVNLKTPQTNALVALRRFTRVASDASQKINNSERIVNPGEDSVSFSASRKIRAELKSIQSVSESSQLNVSELGVALESLGQMTKQLESIKASIVGAQVADAQDLPEIQQRIDTSLARLESTVQSTRLSNRGLLNGESSIRGFNQITADGTKTDFPLFANGESLTRSRGVQAVRVNRLGAGPTRTLDDGSEVLSLRVSMNSAQKSRRAFLSIVPGTAADSFVEFRLTGKLGSATMRIVSTGIGLVDMNQAETPAESFNLLAQETGLILTWDLTTLFATNRMGISTVGFGDDEFIKAEIISVNDGAGTAATFNGLGGGDAVGQSVTDFGKGATATINGTEVELGGIRGTTARYTANGNDIEIDFGTDSLDRVPVGFNIANNVNIAMEGGSRGLVGSGAGDSLRYAYSNFTTENLGRGNAQDSATIYNFGGALHLSFGALPNSFGNRRIDDKAVIDLSAGGRVALSTGNFSEAIRTIDRALDQVLTESTRLGTYQSIFIDTLSRLETQAGVLTSADADVIGVDAATEITNLVQAQLGISTTTSVLSQMNAIQANIFSLLRG